MSKPQGLNLTREQITSLDNELLTLLSKRRALSLEVARSKEVDVRPIRDTQREKELLERLVLQGREKGLDAHFVISLYQSIIEDSVLNQQAYLQGRANPDTQKAQYTVAFLGARGSYSFLAAHRYCDRRHLNMIEFGCTSFDDIVNAVESGHADYGFLPIENTSSGSINEVYDVLQHTSLSIIGETTIEVGHCLLAKSGTKFSDIRTVYAHPQPISQCSRYLSQHPHLKLEYCSSSAEAMSKVIEANSNTVAAIGSSEGGALYQLTAVESGIANQKINQSRFIVVARKAVDVPSQLPAKTTFIMATGQKPGALVEALLVLKAHNLNMTKLESRPIPGTPWEEMFYIDIDGNLASTDVQQAVKELERLTRFIKVLGCYPCETVKPTQLSQSQLLIEPNSSKADNTPLESNQGSTNTPKLNQDKKYSRAYREQESQIHCKNLSIGESDLMSMQTLSLPIDETSLASTAKHSKEAGIQLIALNHVSSMDENQVRKLLQIIEQAGCVSAIEIEQEADLNLAPFSDMIYLCGMQMFNQSLLKQLGALNRAVILERNNMASVSDWLDAAETMLTNGNQQVVLCEAGMRNFTQPDELQLDLAGLIHVKSQSHLPVICHVGKLPTQTQFEQAVAAKKLGAHGVGFSHELLPQEQLTALLK